MAQASGALLRASAGCDLPQPSSTSCPNGQPCRWRPHARSAEQQPDAHGPPRPPPRPPDCGASLRVAADLVMLLAGALLCVPAKGHLRRGRGDQWQGSLGAEARGKGPTAAEFRGIALPNYEFLNVCKICWTSRVSFATLSEYWSLGGDNARINSNRVLRDGAGDHRKSFERRAPCRARRREDLLRLARVKVSLTKSLFAGCDHLFGRGLHADQGISIADDLSVAEL